MTTFNDNTSLFEIKTHFINLKATPTLNFEQWIDHGNIGKIYLHIDCMDQIAEILRYLKLEFKQRRSEIEVGEYFDENKLKRKILSANTYKKVRKFKRHFIINKYENNIRIHSKKRHIDIVEKISKEIVNYVGNDCHIHLNG